MPDKSSVLVQGVGELASAVARTLLLSGHAVALHQSAPEPVLRRKMAFADAWWDGLATLEGVEACRVTQDADLLAGLRGGMFIPLITHPVAETVGRWPWDVIVDARGEKARACEAGRQLGDAELMLVLGPGAEAGVDCDLVIEVSGPDPGAVLRAGAATGGVRALDRYEVEVAAPGDGTFASELTIGMKVRPGQMIGLVGTQLVVAPCEGRIRGLLRTPRAVRAGEPVAEVIADPQVPVSGIARPDQMIARAVAFTIELEQEGLSHTPWTAPGRE